MDYRLIKENFDKATAKLEEAEPGAPSGAEAQQGAPAFAVGDRVKFSSEYEMRSSKSRKALARGEVTGAEWVEHSLTTGPMYPPQSAYVYTVAWDEGYKPLAVGGKPRTNIGTYFDFELAPATD